MQGKHTNYFGFGILSETSLGVSGNKQLRHAVPRSSPADRCASTRRSPMARRACRPSAFGGNPCINTSVTTGERAVHERALLVQREQQASHQVRHRSCGAIVRAGSHDKPARDASASIRSPISRRAFRRRSRDSSRRARAARASTSARCRSAIRTVRTATCRSSTACASTATASRPSRCSTPTSSGCSASRTTTCRIASTRARASASRGRTAQAPEIAGFDGRVPRSARGRARRHRHVPEHAERRGDRLGDGQHRFAEWRAAARVRRARGTRRRTGRRTWQATARCRRQCADGTTGTVFSSTAPNVSLFDKNYVGAALAALEPQLAGTAARQPLRDVRST